MTRSPLSRSFATAFTFAVALGAFSPAAHAKAKLTWKEVKNAFKEGFKTRPAFWSCAGDTVTVCAYNNYDYADAVPASTIDLKEGEWSYVVCNTAESCRVLVVKGASPAKCAKHDDGDVILKVQNVGEHAYQVLKGKDGKYTLNKVSDDKQHFKHNQNLTCP